MCPVFLGLAWSRPCSATPEPGRQRGAHCLQWGVWGAGGEFQAAEALGPELPKCVAQGREYNGHRDPQEDLRAVMGGVPCTGWGAQQGCRASGVFGC